MGRRGSAALAWGILAGLAIAVLGAGRESLASHYSFALTSDCYQCHNLNPDAVATDPATSYILNDSFVKRMKLVNGGTTPAVFGCAFCHQYTSNTVMRDAFFALKSGTSVHPVDFPYSVDALRNVTIDFTSLNRDRAIYNSNWDNSWANFPNQIDCNDCHNVAMDNAAYPNHSPLWTDNTATAANPSTARYYNPFMLWNVPGTPASGYSWSGGAVQGHAPNAFCLLTCHDNSPGNTAKGTRMGHYGWGAYGADNTLKEPSGTAIKGGASARCADCHETHTSRTKDNLFGNLGNQTSSQSYNLVSESNCAAICHSDTPFLASGHKTRPTTAGFTCESCHSSSVSHRDASNPRRLSSSMDTDNATLTQDLSTNGLDDNYNGVIDDAGEQNFAYSFESSCRACHVAYVGHNGTIASGASPSTGRASCLNCHDPHGKAVFNGTDNNAKMVRARVMGENTVYTVRTDMWRSDGRGMCDNPACHGGKPMGDNTLLLGTVMGDVSDHRAAGVTYTTDCTGCHLHTTESGSFAPACNGCHDYPGQTHLSSAHQLSPVHKIHAYLTNQSQPTTETGYGFPCGTCHFSFNHNQMGVANGTQWDNSNNTVVQVVFDPTVNPPGPPDPSYTVGPTPATGTCGNLTCHGARLPAAARGTLVTPRWNVPADGNCGTCHKATGAIPPGTAAHAKHASSDYNSGYNYGCQTCHYSTTADGTTIPVTGRATHVNRLSEVAFNSGNPWVSGGSYTGTATVGDNTVATCTDIYCHSPGYAKTAPFDNGALGAPNWNAGAALACNACHGATGQTGIAVGMPAYANGTPKANTHPKHLGDGFGCQVCHYTTTRNGTSVIGADRIYHVNGVDNVISEGNLAFNPVATQKQLSHFFAFDGALNACNTAVCHGYGPTAPVWGQTAGIPIACGECHKNATGGAAAADADDFTWDNGTMSKVGHPDWSASGHGRTTGTYNSGRNAPGTGGTSTFPSCTTHCHTSAVSHDNAANPFRLTDKATPTPTTDFSDGADPQSDNRVCLDCHSATGALPAGSGLHVEQNHYGLKHNAQTLGGSFCWDCHDPHGDANDSMVQDNVTRVSDGVFGVPSAAAGSTPRATFGKANLNGEAYNTAYDWGDYVDNTNAPPRGICQVCHSDPPGASGGTTGGAAHFSPTRFDGSHNKLAGVQGDRCTVCHPHGADFGPTCNTCHGDATPGGAGGMPPHGPIAGNQAWSSSVDNLSLLPGVGNHRTAAGIAFSSHGALTCQQCHTNTPGSGAATHNVSGQLNATMTNIATHPWYNGAAAAWDNGGTAGATGGVVDDSCSNIDCHAPYYDNNAAASGTPAQYRRYWVNATLWDCYTCHAYDGRTGVGARPRPAGADNTMATGAHGEHVGTSRMNCSRCHDVTGYSYTAFGGNHKNRFVNWSFAGAPNPAGYPAVPANAYTVASGSAFPTDDNAAAGHRQWGTCSNIYCHSIVQTSAGGPLTAWVGYATASWDNATTGQCGACHNDDLNTSGGTGVPMASGSHARHLASGYAMACDACHTGSGTGHATHADGMIQVPIGDNTWRVFTLTAAATVFDRSTLPGVDNANKTPGAARGRCSNIACHTNGAGGVPRVSPAVWGDNQAAATNCTYCHGGNSASGAAMATNAHGKHMAFGYLCSTCHADTAAAGTDNVLNAAVGKGAALHVDNQAQVLNGNGYTFGWNGGTKDCSNISCHGGSAANWVTGVGALKCANCHLSTADTDQYLTVNDTWFSNDNTAALNTTEWGYSGHGKASLSYDVSGHPAADFPGGALSGAGDPCLYCHDAASTHRLAANPFRLKDQTGVSGYAGDGWNATCLVCHSNAPSPPGYGTALGYTNKIAASNDRVDTAHYGTKHALDNTSGGRFCWDCHDAHGDRSNSTTGNIYMVQSVALGKTDGVYGYRGTLGEATLPVTFKADNAVNLGGDWARSDFRGVCQVCHHGNGTGSASEAKYYTPTAFQNHNQDRVCTDCHKHNDNFRASCNICHGEATGPGSTGMPPYAPSAGNNPWPSRTTVDNLSALAGVGNHRTATGIAVSSHGTFPCTECHTATPGSGATHDNTSNANAVMTNLLARKWTDGTTATTWTARNAARTVTSGSVVDDSCNNVNCHSPYYDNNAAMSGTPFPYERYWENRTLWDCYTCHGYSGAADTTNNSTPPIPTRTIATGSHTAHVNYLNTTYACDTCHPNNGVDLAHKDGLVQVPVTGTLGAVTLAGSYSVSPAQSPTDNGAGHRAWGTCSNAYCHSTVQKNNPDGLPNDGVTYNVTPQWGAGSASVYCGSCHKGAGTDHAPPVATWIDTGSHTVHAQTKGYRCTNCHQYPGQPPSGSLGKCGGCHPMDGTVNRHVDGYINVRFGDTIDPDNVFILSGVFDANGDHVNDNTIVPGMPYGTCESLYCHGTGSPALTGGANQLGSPNIPRWGTANTSLCGSCHGGPGGAANYAGASNWPSSGAHSIHMDNTSMAGPRISACTDCHTSDTVSTHVNGAVDLRTRYDNTSATTLSLTQTCDPCHGPGAAAAKSNWSSAGALDCLTCHMTGSLANSRADLTGVSAPNVGGDNATYGSYYTGHNRTTGIYSGSGNSAANRSCTDCHDASLRHINHVGDNSYQGNRLTATVPWNSVSTGGTVGGLCAACHTTTANPSAGHNKVNTHGNTGFSGINHDTGAQGFAYNCDACHDAHGMTLNGRVAGTYNIYMIKTSIEVRNFSTGVDTTPDNTTTTGPVYFELRSGSYSFDDNTSANANRLCVTCHVSASRPGNSTALNVSGGGGSHSGTPGGDYATDERGRDCSSCHNHNKDDNTATVDGLMPQQCNACHSYPGLDNSAVLFPNQRQMGTAHWDHSGKPLAGGTDNSHGFLCTVCHLNYQHNQSNIPAGGSWSTFNANTVNIRFDSSWNPVNANGPRYNGILADPANGTVGIGGGGACAGLYCHGDSASSTVGWGGSDNTPVWNQASTGACGTCHDAGTADTTPGTRISTGNHPVHLDNVSRLYGPDPGQFGVGTNCQYGTGCHTQYGLTPTSTHVNSAVNFRRYQTTSDNVPVDLAGTGVCRNCHSTYASTSGTGDTLVRTQANWDNASYKVACITCHNASAGQQGTQSMDGTGHLAPNVEAAWAGNGHGASGIDNTSTTTDSGAVDQVPPVRCETCHDEAGQHIGTAKDGTNPWRLDNALTGYTQTGGLDKYCLERCHTLTAAPPRHAWRVTGSALAPLQTKDNNVHTHPTTAESVPTGKDRWLQATAETTMPVAADLLSKSPPARSSASLVVCVTCHDPHGVGTAAISGRSFSGANDNGFQMLRYKGGSLTVLCAKCHK